jgi:hypothetical protein
MTVSLFLSHRMQTSPRHFPSIRFLLALWCAAGILLPARSAFASTTPIITASTSILPGTATSITINGSNFDPTAANNTVSFSDGVFGTVTAATATQLTVQLAHDATAVGNLTAVVTTDGHSSGTPTQVATVNVITTFTGIQSSGGTVTLNFTGVPNTTYGLQYSQTLLSASWSNVAPVTTNGTGSGQYVGTPASSTLGFYRLVYPAP